MHVALSLVRFRARRLAQYSWGGLPHCGAALLSTEEEVRSSLLQFIKDTFVALASLEDRTEHLATVMKQRCVTLQPYCQTLLRTLAEYDFANITTNTTTLLRNAYNPIVGQIVVIENWIQRERVA